MTSADLLPDQWYKWRTYYVSFISPYTDIVGQNHPQYAVVATRGTDEHFVVRVSELQPIPKPPKPLRLYKVFPFRKNWKFHGYREILVAATDAYAARKINPSTKSPTEEWPIQLWCDRPGYLIAEYVGTADSLYQENEVISVFYQGEEE